MALSVSAGQDRRGAMGEASFLTQRHVKLEQLYFLAVQLYLFMVPT